MFLPILRAGIFAIPISRDRIGKRSGMFTVPHLARALRKLKGCFQMDDRLPVSGRADSCGVEAVEDDGDTVTVRPGWPTQAGS